jgi:hypothetical protein
MKNNYIILMLLLLSFLGVKAQNTGLNRESFNYRYTQLPNLVLDNTQWTYSLNINKSDDFSAYSDEWIAKRIPIDGKELVDADGKIQVTLNLGKLNILKTGIDERIQVVKDKDGNEKGKNYYYYLALTYTFEANATVVDQNGENITDLQILSDKSNRRIWVSHDFGSREQANDFLLNNISEIRKKIAGSHFDDILPALTSSLNYSIGYEKKNTTKHLWKLGTKKHPEYEAFGHAVYIMKSHLEGINESALNQDNLIYNLKSQEEYFKSIPNKYADTKDKGQVKLRYGAYYNLAAYYLYSEQFDKAKEYAELLIANGHNHKDGEKLLQDLNSTKASLEKHGLPSRHFYPAFLYK